MFFDYYENIFKNNQKDKYPITQFSLPCKDEEVDFVISYNLKGTINHIGNLHSGHYKAMIKHHKSWYECNDSATIKVAENNVCCDCCYMLFTNIAFKYNETGKGTLLTIFSGFTHPLFPSNM